MAIRKKPWNRVNAPVYSICSKGASGFNMNICTYVTPVSMQPKRYMIGIYLGTQTLENAERSDELILQILADSQYRLVNQLGKLSGSKIDKIARLQKRKLLTTWKDFPVLKDAIACIRLRKLARWEAGDHVCFLFDVMDYFNQTEAKPLDLFTLKKNGIIRS
jgi:flavin reductase (DIM6/NTAB) family NADH-FMN oxidoreductase RutF